VNGLSASKIPALLVVLATFALYLPSLWNPLVWDDTIHLERARAATSVVPARGGEEYLRPVVSRSYDLQVATGTDSAALLHAVNVVLHARSTPVFC